MYISDPCLKQVEPVQNHFGPIEGQGIRLQIKLILVFPNYFRMVFLILDHCAAPVNCVR